MPVSSSPAAMSCSANGGEKEVRVKLTMGRKAAGSPCDRLVDETTCKTTSQNKTKQKGGR